MAVSIKLRVTTKNKQGIGKVAQWVTNLLHKQKNCVQAPNTRVKMGIEVSIYNPSSGAWRHVDPGAQQPVKPSIKSMFSGFRLCLKNHSGEIIDTNSPVLILSGLHMNPDG